jgi:hypothetical protein
MKRGISVFFQLLIFLSTVILVATLSYVISRPYLTGNNLLGNDAYSFYSVVLWFNKYFPNIPFWYPLAGGGVSLASGYPVFAAYIVSFITRVSSLDLIQSFRLLGFLSVPMLSLGVFFLVYTCLTSIKSGLVRATLGLVAAALVVVSPNSWLWLTRWGFYAESVSYIFAPWAILFFNLYLENAIEGKYGWGYRFGILGSVIFLLLSFLTHFLSLASLVVFFILTAFIRFLTASEKKSLIAKRIFSSGLILGLIVAGVAFFKLTSYEYYTGQVSLGGFSGYGRMAYSEMANNTLPLPMMLSLKSPTTIMDPHALIFDMRFPLYVWILFAAGFLFSIKKSSKIFSFGVYGVVGLILSSILSIKYFVSGIPLISAVANLMESRGYLMVARVIVPIVAVYGAYIIWETLFQKIIPKLNSVRESFSVLFAVGCCVILVGLFYNSPYKLPFMIGTGVDSGVIDIRDIWNKMPHPSQLLYSPDIKTMIQNPEYLFANFNYMKDICLKTKMTLIDSGSICDSYLQNKDLVFPPTKLISESKSICDGKIKSGALDEKYQFCKAFYIPLVEQLKLKNWPAFSISSDISAKEKEVGDIFTQVPKENFRFDLSGFTGGDVMATPLVTQNSQIQIYINTLSLIYNSWNYQTQVMYSSLASTQKPGVLTELGKWFGLNYVYLKGSTLEPAAYWQTDSNWESLGNPGVPGGWEKFKIPVSLVSWDNRPKILVVTDVKRGLYDQTFRFATWGALPYDKFNLIIGQKSIDSYTVDDLKSYDAVVMRGYSYKSQPGAYNLLNRYVSGGGKLLFDTGWQFEIPDYILNKAPDFMPFESLDWENLDVNSTFSLSGGFNGIDAAKFGDLKYGSSSWGVSVAQNIKSGANIDLSYDGKPLVISGKYGKGDVTWIGFNIVAHAIAKDSIEEAKFFNALATNLLGDKQISNLNTTITRINPDKVEFDLKSTTTGNSGIYFRESYFPYWRAYLEKGSQRISLKIEKAGPGFIYINLPLVASGDKVILEIQISIWQKVADFVSILSGILLLSYFIKPSLFSWIKIPKFKIKLSLPGLSKDENEDY